MRIYIAGKITGTDDFMERFADCEKRLTGQGFSVVNPAAVNNAFPKDATHGEYMRISLVLLDMCDGIYMMQGWEDSPGASMEYGYALAAGKIIIQEDGNEPADV